MHFYEMNAALTSKNKSFNPKLLNTYLKSLKWHCWHRCACGRLGQMAGSALRPLRCPRQWDQSDRQQREIRHWLSSHRCERESHRTDSWRVPPGDSCCSVNMKSGTSKHYILQYWRMCRVSLVVQSRHSRSGSDVISLSGQSSELQTQENRATADLLGGDTIQTSAPTQRLRHYTLVNGLIEN